MADGNAINDLLNVSFIGFGEAASAFVQGWRHIDNLALRAFDTKTTNDQKNISEGKWSDYEAMEVSGQSCIEDALLGTKIVFSVVTADQAFDAASSTAEVIQAGCFYFDCNSCAPGTKKRSAGVINAAGGKYVDVAVMSPVHPKLHKTPLLICGQNANEALPVFEALEMEATLVEGDVGTASSVKMIRSIMVKGLEALMTECVLAGREAGVDQMVLASLEKSYPGFGFEERAAYMFERMTTHGIRRAAEMREVALTVEELGLPNDLTLATVEWQQRMGDLNFKSTEPEYKILADELLRELEKTKRS